MRYTFVKQYDSTDCAAACLAMVCLHYKKETSISQLRDRMGTDLKGTNLIGLTKCAQELGFTAQAVRVDREGFASEFTLPCIAHIITGEGLSHFVVLFKKSEKYVVVGDPAKDLMRITVDEFYEKFTGVLLLLKPTNAFETGKKSTQGIFRQYVRLLLPHKNLFACAVAASFLITLLGIVSSLFNKMLMDEILPYKLEGTLRMTVIAFTGISLVSCLIDFERQYVLLYLSQKIDIPLMLGYFRHIFRLPMKFFSTRRTGDIITRFSDAGTIKSVFTSIALSLVLDVSMALISGVVLFNMSTRLFAVILFMTAVSILLVLIYRPIYKKINEEQMQQASVLNSEIIEGLRGVETIKGNANEDVELENIEREYIRSLRIGLREGKMSAGQSLISSVIDSVGNMILVYLGIQAVIAGDMTLGTYMAFTTLASYFTSPVSDLVGMQLQIQEAQISMKRLSEILDTETEQAEGDFQELEKADAEIEIRDVTFRYGHHRPALKNISFTIRPGEKVALVGASGSGKSTLAKLLLKYYEPESGSITIGGVDLQEYSNASVRRAISYVPQNIELFSKSIYDNIRISKPGATLEDVKEAAKKADAHDFIRRLPGQYATFLEEAGNGLSGGEKQRIVLARAFLKDSGFYILDESTSSLDFATENVIFDMIYNKLAHKSMLIIAHRLATVRNCDRILVLSEGEVIESGSHEELIARGGEYYRLWEMQQGNRVRKEVEEPEREIYNQGIEDEVTY
ncbi:MAG: peptidase domain-containing ABC transporter [Lachnospiraceae bacterium]|nr:peptidase domain-containing ABC transporter [Lachnospiraceae bacterium]